MSIGQSNTQSDKPVIKISNDTSSSASDSPLFNTTISGSIPGQSANVSVVSRMSQGNLTVQPVYTGLGMDLNNTDLDVDQASYTQLMGSTFSVTTASHMPVTTTVASVTVSPTDSPVSQGLVSTQVTDTSAGTSVPDHSTTQGITLSTESPELDHTVDTVTWVPHTIVPGSTRPAPTSTAAVFKSLDQTSSFQGNTPFNSAFGQFYMKPVLFDSILKF